MGSVLEAVPGLFGVGSLVQGAARADQRKLQAPSADLDPNAVGLIMDQQARADRPQSAIVAEQLQGTPQGAALDAALNEQGQRAQAQGGNSAALSHALSQKARSHYGLGMSRLQRQAELEAPMKQAQDRMIELNAQIRGYGNAANVYSQQRQSYEAMRNARSGIISGVLGLGGQMVGMGMGGQLGGGGAQQPSSLQGYQSQPINTGSYHQPMGGPEVSGYA